MASSWEEAYTTIKEYIDNNGEFYPTWYAGIASDPKARLFQDHNIPDKGGKWIVDSCPDADEARKVVDALIRIGCKGNRGGGDSNSRYVYAYLITPGTRE